ncbi:MAG: FIST C-terminal domain-containing protein [Candidatus Omnitrophica bacterium]|nr:FIST C-terminal domain-containing protein [Candidatus Omnitrophota bacterium]MCM8770703.1 FIST C-terminal domain-containing protein [Candidatus Omnitrophota bacterium]
MSLWVGVGTSTNKEPALAAAEALEKARSKIPQTKRINLVMVFATIGLSTLSFLKTLTQRMPQVPLVGCSTAAIISHLGIYLHGAIVILFSFQDITWNTAHINNIRLLTPLISGEELGNRLIYGYIGKHHRQLGILISDGLNEGCSMLLKGLQEKLGLSFPIVGAAASDNFNFLRTYLYYNNEIFSDGAMGILLGGNLRFGLGVRHGWKPLGRMHRVTAADGNTVKFIDGKPAVDVYRDYFAKDISELKKDLKIISLFYPLGIYLSGEKEYLLRNIRAIKDDGSLVCQGDIPEDSEVRLMIGTKESCLAATREAAEEAKTTLKSMSSPQEKEDLPLKLVLVFDSLSRYRLLGKDARLELEIIQETLGADIPLAGLYTFGEQMPLKAVNYFGRTHFHNQTISILSIKG